MPLLSRLLARPLRTLALFLPLALLLAIPALRVRFSGSLLDLLPERPVARALARAVDAVAASDVDLALVEATSPEAAQRAADRLAALLVARTTIAAALSRIALTETPAPADLYRALIDRADDQTLDALRRRFSLRGANEAAERIRAIALAPGGGAMREQLTHDPYDLAPLLAARLRHVGAALHPGADGTIASDDERARLVILRGRGSAFDLAFDERMAADVHETAARVAREVPGTRIRWTGPHAIALATRDLIRDDMRRSSTLAALLVSAVLLFAVRRVRALLAVGVPLLIGAAWTSALAALLLRGFNAISVAFAAIVLGVGLDTGVHLYERVLTERRAGLGASAAAERALRAMITPVLTAAVTAAAAFASLGASELRALRELGSLAAAGEVLTALAIVALTPPLAALLERGPAPDMTPGGQTIARVVSTVVGSRAAPAVVLMALFALALFAALGPRPRFGQSVLLVRPRALEPLRVQADVFARFGGEPGQWMAVADAPDLESALEGSEGLERALAPLEASGLLAGYDTLASLAPSLAAQRARRDALRSIDPVGAADRLAAALAARGARVALFEPGLRPLRDPLPAPVLADPLAGPAAPLAARFLARRGERYVYVAYVRPGRGHDLAAVRASVERALARSGTRAVLTGYPLLEADLRSALGADVLRVGSIAATLVTALLALTLRSARALALALAGIGAELLGLWAFLALTRVPLDAYNLLALPALVGITIDEVVFVLHAYNEAEGNAAARARAAVRAMAPATSATAAATASGFLALVSCRFEALRGLGLVAGAGTLLGLISALVVVPVLARVWWR